MNRTTHKAKVSKLILVVLLTLTVVFSIGCGKKDTPSKTPTAAPTGEAVTPTGNQTATEEPTKEPTPTATPEPDDSGLFGLYGDITQYLEKPAADLIAKLGEDYQYEHSGKDYLIDYFEKPDVDPGSASGVMYYDSALYFNFTDSEETLQTDCAVRTITVKNDAGKTLSVNLGHGLNIRMTFSQLKEAMGDAFIYEPASQVYARYRVYGIFHGYRYFFSWKKDPTQHDKPADYVIVSQTRLDDVVEEASRKVIDGYYQEQQEELMKHKEQYLPKLRDQYEGIPVYCLAPLTTIPLDESNRVEIYECAAFGCASLWKEKNYSYEITGFNSAKELLGYSVFGRLVSDVADASELFYVYDVDVDVPGGSWETDCTDAYVSFPNREKRDAWEEELCKLVGLPYSKTNDINITVHVGTDTWISNSYALVVDATYLNGEETPLYFRKFSSYRSNDGGTEDLQIFMKDGAELNLYPEKTIRSGSGELDGSAVNWALKEDSAGHQIVFVGCPEQYSEDWYVYMDGQLFPVYGEVNP